MKARFVVIPALLVGLSGCYGYPHPTGAYVPSYCAYNRFCDLSIPSGIPAPPAPTVRRDVVYYVPMPPAPRSAATQPITIVNESVIAVSPAYPPPGPGYTWAYNKDLGGWGYYSPSKGWYYHLHSPVSNPAVRKLQP